MPVVKTPFISQKSIRSVGEIYNNIKDGHTDLSPAYQRPSVWTQQQKINLIHSLFHEVPVPAITINDRWEANQDIHASYLEAVIDGKQRLEAIVDFMEDRLAVPADWFFKKYLVNSKAETVTYSQMTPGAQTVFKRTPLLINIATFQTEAEEAKHYLTVNTAGTEQAKENLDNARAVAQDK